MLPQCDSDTAKTRHSHVHTNVHQLGFAWKIVNGTLSLSLSISSIHLTISATYTDSCAPHVHMTHVVCVVYRRAIDLRDRQGMSHTLLALLPSAGQYRPHYPLLDWVAYTHAQHTHTHNTHNIHTQHSHTTRTQNTHTHTHNTRVAC